MDKNDKRVVCRVEDIDDRGDYPNGEEEEEEEDDVYEYDSEGSGRSSSIVDNAYFQSFVLGVAFMAIWTPQSLMAPNLTAMAETFGFDNAERDRLLGAHISLATSVFSLPLSALVGFLADFVTSRRNLYAGTIFVGGVACYWSGRTTTFTGLLVSRFVTGGCMSGCTPVAFSLLGDLFETRERNMASSALTAMMGVGIITGNLIAGMMAPWTGWRAPFDVSAACCVLSASSCLWLVDEPVRGGKEEILRDMIKQGRAYDRKLTRRGFFHAMLNNSSNFIILVQGFFCNVPFGIIFIFLNDYLSQEQGLSVRSATFLVCVYGVGCAVGGILGGYWGGHFAHRKQTYLPVFMGATTIIGVFPYLGLLDVALKGHRSNFIPVVLAFFSGMIESMPSVNIRPCLINVNPPEMRGAALTTANLIINLARGVGPLIMTKICAYSHVPRKESMNVILIFFWVIAGMMLFLLVFTLPQDKENMEKELARYANSLTAKSEQPKNTDEETPLFNKNNNNNNNITTTTDPVSSPSTNHDEDLDITVLSIEERRISFNGDALRDSLMFMSGAFQYMNLINGDSNYHNLNNTNSYNRRQKPRAKRSVSYANPRSGGSSRRFKYKISNPSTITTLRRQASLPIGNTLPLTFVSENHNDGSHVRSTSSLPGDSFP